MPMTTEVVIQMFATFKIGAIFIPIFSGFAAPAIAERLKEIGYEGYINYEFCHMPFQGGKVLGYDNYIDDQIRLAQIYFKDLIDNA